MVNTMSNKNQAPSSALTTLAEDSIVRRRGRVRGRGRREGYEPHPPGVRAWATAN